jgi:hypothetical protein
MLFRLKGQDSLSGMQVIRHANRDHIHPWVSQKVLVIFMNFGSGLEFLDQLGGTFHGTAAYRRQEEMWVIPDRLGMFDRNLPGAPNPHTYWIFLGTHGFLHINRLPGPLSLTR